MVQGVTVSGTTSAGIQVNSSSNVTILNATVSGTTGQGIYVTSSSSNVTITGATVTQTTENGIYATGSSSVTIQNSHVSYAGQPLSGYTKKGIYLSNTSSSVVQGNTSDHNSDSGIYLASGSTNDVVSGNVTFSNARQYTRAAPGIDVRSSGNTVANNISYSNEDSGIQFYNGGGSSLVYNNICYNNGDHGIDNLNSPNQIIVSNTVYGNTTSGINVEGTAGTTASQGATLQNNIAVDNGLHSFGTKGNIRVDANSTLGTTIDYDLVNLSSTGTMFTWGNTQYTSLWALQAATGQEAHGLQGDPLWASPGTGNFQLQEGSPGIDSANSAAPGQPATDAGGAPRVDDPSTPNTGSGPRTYDDRGALEYQPSTVTS
jgi:parallel beta-helix repeat protein